MISRKLIELAYYAVHYDGQYLDLASLTAEERAAWDDIAALHAERDRLQGECEYEAADQLLRDAEERT